MLRAQLATLSVLAVLWAAVVGFVIVQFVEAMTI